jgi:long-subunit fatty acid transport protein
MSTAAAEDWKIEWTINWISWSSWTNIGQVEEKGNFKLLNFK